MQYITVLTLVIAIVQLALIVILLMRGAEGRHSSSNGQLTTFGSLIGDNLKENRESQLSQLRMMDKSLTDKMGVVTSQLEQFERRLHSFTSQTTQSLENIRDTVDNSLLAMRLDNNEKFDEMRKIVDEKLQKTLNDRMNESFRLVSERLEQVYKGLGEMQTLAQGVGDLKKVLTNVKTRGILGEVQLGSILDEILAPEQYETNVATRPGSRNVVEFAVKLPTEGGGSILLPIDSKFPGDTYAALRDAYDLGSREQIDACAARLVATLKSEAKDIRDKYLEPPHTTDFGIMFLPFEGLYAEAVNRGMVEILQRDYNVNIAGPSTMAALLNALQMSFRTIAIQKRSGEVWDVLSAVKTEFGKFETCLTLTQTRLDQASRELDKLVGVRTRAICRKLKNVTELNESDASAMLSEDVD